jgi:hypothetical protein
LKIKSPIERQILDYLAENPEARDTARGIIEWWLLKQSIAQTTSDVETALAKLVADGRVSTRAAPDGQIYYGAGMDASENPVGDR